MRVASIWLMSNDVAMLRALTVFGPQRRMLWSVWLTGPGAALSQQHAGAVQCVPRQRVHGSSNAPFQEL